MSTELADEGQSVGEAVRSSYESSAPSPELSKAFSDAEAGRHQAVRERNRGLDRFEAEARSSENLRSAVSVATALHTEKPDEQAKPEKVLPTVERPVATSSVPASEPEIAEYREIQKSIAPAMERLRSQGVTASKAIENALQWEAALSDPVRGRAAYEELGERLGFRSSQPPSQPSVSPQFDRTYGELQKLPHFNTVSRTMGSLLDLYGSRYEKNGAIDYAAIHRDALKHHGIAEPKAASAETPRAKGLSARESIKLAVRQLREAS